MRAAGGFLLLSEERGPRASSRDHVGDAIDRIADLSPTPSTSPMSVAGVGDRSRMASLA